MSKNKYIPPVRGGRQQGSPIILVYTDGLNDALQDFGLPPVQERTNNKGGLIMALIGLAYEVGLEDVNAIGSLGATTLDFKHPDWAKTKEYYIVEQSDMEQANSLVSNMNTFFQCLSAHVSNRRVENLRKQQTIIDAEEQLCSLNGDVPLPPPPPYVGSFSFISVTATSGSITNAAEAKMVIKRQVGIQHTADSVSLVLFRRPAQDEPPTHVLTYRSKNDPQKRELVGGGKMNMAVGISLTDDARRKLYEETFGLVSSLPVGLPVKPLLVWKGYAMKDTWYAMNYAMVVTDDEDGKIEGLVDILNIVSDELENPFQVDPLSTIHPTIKDYQWTLVDDFKGVCRFNLKKSWHNLYKKVVKENILVKAR